MVTTIKQLVTVGAGGSVAFQSPELREGESAQLIVVVDRPGETNAAGSERVHALVQLRSTLKLTEDAAQRWEADILAERAARH